MRSLRMFVAGVSVLAAVGAVCFEVLPSAATAQGQGATRRVIVVLKNQETSLPPTRSHLAARRRAIQNLQAPVERQLSSSAARSVHSYDVINAVSATVSPNEESQLKSNPAVSKVVPDQVIQLAPGRPRAHWQPAPQRRRSLALARRPAGRN